ncbi:toll-like receptor 7 [Culicoides brevitarsis]|uniref:toll-like receptor 7 n=1 Tax=Culicoides brevitarsis TaxID=469753 RepID=UPI00307C998C
MSKIVLFFLIATVTADELLKIERCSPLFAELNTCTLVNLHYNKTNFEFMAHYDPVSTLKVRVLNSSLPKLGKNGICMTKYSSSTDLSITELDLKNAEIEEILPTAFENCVALQKINLKNNKIAILEPETFSKNRELQIIDLTSNLIRSLHDKIFADLTNLKELRLCNNFLVEFEPQLIANCVNLETLRLDSNELFDLKVQKITKNENLKTIAFNNNQLRCAKMRKIEENLREKNIFVDPEYEGRAKIIPTNDSQMLCLDDIAWTAAHYVFMYDKETTDD